jgi:5-hydroxytryptamine receptor 1
VSIAISIAPLLGWRQENENPEVNGACMISQDPGYTIFSTVGAFYCPLMLMLVLNFKIYRAARYRIRRKRFLQGTHRANLHHRYTAII